MKFKVAFVERNGTTEYVVVESQQPGFHLSV